MIGEYLVYGTNLPCCSVLFLCSSSQRTPSLSRHSHRAPSVADSMAEYFDASEVILCDTSSEAEASDESGLSDITTTSNSEPDEGHGERWSTTHLFLYFYSSAKNVDKKFYVNYFLLLSSATATLKYRTSLNNAPDKPSSAQTSTGNVPILCRLYKSAAVADVSLSLCFK